MLRFVVILFFLFVPSITAADKVHLLDGKIIEGKIIAQNETSVKIKQNNGIIRHFFKFQYDFIEENFPDPDAIYEDEPVNLDELTPVEGIFEDKQELIKQLIYLTGMRVNVDKIINRVIDQAPLERRDEMRQIFNAEEVIEELKPIYDKYYTVEELQKLVTLYGSSLGQKILEVTPKISRDAMAATLMIFQKKIRQ